MGIGFNKKKIILSCDGGGVKGILSAVIIDKISKLAGKHPTEIFDFFIGSSTGGIICALLNMPKNFYLDRTPLYSTEDVINFYTSEPVKKIFKSKFLRLPLSTKYPSDNIEEVLKEKLGTVLLSDSIKPLMLTTYDTTYREDLYSVDDREFLFLNSMDQSYKDIKMWEGCRATSSAPTYFEPFRLGDKCFIDGGTFCNNPALIGYASAKQMFSKNEVIVVSVGTGSSTKSIPYKDISKWNLLNWASNIYGISSDGQNDSTSFALKKLIPEENFFRFNLKLPESLDEMDNVSDKNISNLLDLANQSIDGIWRKKLDSLVTIL